MAHIYLIRNLINGKGYIGQTRKSVLDRWKEHQLDAEKRNSKQALHSALRKYGISNFAVVTVISCELIYLDEMERYFIKLFNTHIHSGHGYNVTFGGLGVVGYRPSEETKRKMSLAHKLRNRQPHSAETRARMAEAKRGKKQSPEHIAKLSAVRRGKRATAETKAKMSESQKRRYRVN